MTEPFQPFPEPLEDDDDDVAWALQTAKVQWTRGGRHSHTRKRGLSQS